LHHFQDITTFMYVTACDLQKSFSFDMTVKLVIHVEAYPS